MELATDKIRAHAEDGIGWLTFNNPARRNAVSLEMWQGLGDALEAFQNDAEVRVVVLTGAGGKAFVSGADISEFDSKRGDAEAKQAYARVAAHGNQWLARLDKPIVAMIQGFCIGGGMAIALQADVRFATPASRFGIPAARLGLGYEYPGVAKLARVVGPANARDIFLSARMIEADEAQRMGLVNFICHEHELESEVRAYAARIAANAPLTVRACKAAIDAWESDPERRDLDAIEAMVNACFDSDDYREGRRAFMEKRSPEFKGH